jgi:hypothetical protein
MVSGFQGFRVSRFQGFIQIGIGIAIGVAIGIGIDCFTTGHFVGFLGFMVSGFMGFKVSGFLGFMVSGFKVSGFQGFRVSGFMVSCHACGVNCGRGNKSSVRNQHLKWRRPGLVLY